MAERLRVVSGTLSYPADAEGLALVRMAGGFSKLSADDRAKVQLKIVSVGDFCDDMPAESVELRLERGEIERITVPDPEPESLAPTRRRRSLEA